MNFYKKGILVLCLIMCFTVVRAQSDLQNIDTIAGRFITKIRKDKSEKILVHTNKWYYTAGEDLWFKAFVINGVSHKYYSRSKTLFVDLVDEHDTAVAQLLLSIPSERTEGYIRISDSIPEGHYWLRAYTENILKEDSSSIFVKPIYIVNPKQISKLTAFEKQGIENRKNTSQPTIRFFAEGASVVTGINANFVVNAIDTNGHPMKVEGFITDNEDSSAITWFSTGPSTGLGKFNFYIGKNKMYTAHIKWNNKILYYTLPQANHYASQLSIKQQTATSIKVVVSQGDSLYKKGFYSYLLAVNKDSICFASVGKDMYEVNIQKSFFPKGESTLLLFNDQQQIVSERPIYITHPADEINIKLENTQFKAREKVELTLVAGDSLFHPVFAALSVAVTDDSVVQDPIYLDGPMVNVNDTTPEINDLLMLAKDPLFMGQSVKNINLNEQPLLISNKTDEFSTTIKGRVMNKKNSPVPNRIVTLYANKKITLFDTDTTDAEGRFNFSIPPHFDSVQFTLQTTNLRGSLVDDKILIDLISPFPKFTTPFYLRKKITPQQSLQVANYRTKKVESSFTGTGKEWLKEVVVKTSIKNKTYNTAKRISNFSQVLTGEAIQKMSSNDASNAMLMIPGLHMRGGYLTLGGVTSFTLSQKDEPLLIVDGIMVAGGNGPGFGSDTEANYMHINTSPVMEELSKIPTDIIDFVEVLKGPEAAYYGTRSSNGVIIVNTHRVSNFRNHFENYGVLQYSPKSYHLPPNFISPDYSNLFLKENTLKDIRSTLYWNGHLYTNKNGKANIEFYTSDNTTSYTVTILGITSSGEIIDKKIKIKNTN